MLWIIFIVFFCVFLFVSLYGKKFNNPYKLIYLFGKKGAGKSTLMVKWMVRDLRHGWNVYTDMPDVSIPGVRSFNTLDLSKYAPPPRSALYLDEIGLSMDNRNFKNFPSGLRDFFALQRKYKCKVIVNSQALDADKKIRDRIDSMYLCNNLFNFISVARPIKRSIVLTEATSLGESRIADQLKFASLFQFRFTFLPRYFRYFESFNAPAREELPFESKSEDVTLSDVRRFFKKK